MTKYVVGEEGPRPGMMDRKRVPDSWLHNKHVFEAGSAYGAK